MLVEPLQLEGQGDGVIALRHRALPRPDRAALEAFAASVSQRFTASVRSRSNGCASACRRDKHERTRWARKIHDESIQGIGALRLQLATPVTWKTRGAEAAVDAALEGLGHEIDGLRHLITELRPAALDDLGLAAALEALARRAQAIDGLDVTTEIDLSTARARRARATATTRRLDPELESTVYRIVQEALTNVSRHAEASQAAVDA